MYKKTCLLLFLSVYCISVHAMKRVTPENEKDICLFDLLPKKTLVHIYSYLDQDDLNRFKKTREMYDKMPIPKGLNCHLDPNAGYAEGPYVVYSEDGRMCALMKNYYSNAKDNLSNEKKLLKMYVIYTDDYTLLHEFILKKPLKPIAISNGGQYFLDVRNQHRDLFIHDTCKNTEKKVFSCETNKDGTILFARFAGAKQVFRLLCRRPDFTECIRSIFIDYNKKDLIWYSDDETSRSINLCTYFLARGICKNLSSQCSNLSGLF